MSDKTKLTELVTALAMLGGDHPLAVLPVQPAELRNVDDATWTELVQSWNEPDLRPLLDAAFANGRFFREATDALRGRHPRIIEWTGPQRSPGDEVAPIDLRVDHVYLVSCKYLSKITMNASPAHLFDRLLTGGHGRRSTDWFCEVASREREILWRHCRQWLHETFDDFEAPHDPGDLDRTGRRELARRLRVGSKAWPPELVEPYRDLCVAVSQRSAQRWSESLAKQRGAAEAMLWRLLRIGSAPYFVLGSDLSAAAPPLRVRVASPWDWRQRFQLRDFSVAPLDGGQPMVTWRARYRDEHGDHEVRGHVEIRWSHGRFNGPPEAKVYLDTPFDLVPGYFPIQ